jgi:hypothetical protein
MQVRDAEHKIRYIIRFRWSSDIILVFYIGAPNARSCEVCVIAAPELDTVFENFRLVPATQNPSIESFIVQIFQLV